MSERSLALPERRLGLLVLVLVAVAAAPSAFCSLIGDDFQHLADAASANLTAAWLGGDQALAGYYRPLLQASYALQYMLWGKTPLGYHVVNVALHLLVVALVMHVTRLGTASMPISAAAALLFGLCPFASEAWVHLVGHHDLLQAACVLSAIAVMRSGPVACWRAAAVGGLMLLACLARETAALLFPLVAVWPRFPVERTEDKTYSLSPKAYLAALACAALAYLVLRQLVFGGSIRLGNDTELGQVIRALPLLLVARTVDLVLPIHTAPRFLPEDVAALSDGGAVALSCVFAIVFVMVVRRWQQEPWLLWGIAGYCLMVAPIASRAGMHTEGYGRYYYGALALAVAPVVAYMARSHALTRVKMILAVGFVSTYAMVLPAVIDAGRDEVRFSQAAIDEYPDRSHGYGRLAAVLCWQGDARAEALFEQAIAIGPHAIWIQSAARCQISLGHPQKALALSRYGQQMHPGAAGLWYWAAVALERLDQPGAALLEAQQGLVLTPSDRRLLTLRDQLRSRVRKGGPG